MLVGVFSYLWSVSYLGEDFLGNDGSFMLDSLYLVMVFFILGEALLFASFFWAWFHHKWSPRGEVSFLVLPAFLEGVWWKSIPLTNTLLLLSSAVTVTVVHHKLLSQRGGKEGYFFVTLVLAGVFLGLQGVEYSGCSIRIRDRVYGGMFYTLTGFHGFHVLVGVAFLVVSLLFIGSGVSSRLKHLFFELAVYYYHFVDVV